ncbi:MAG: hypothetical protein IPJ40_14945 [Saprospirales bacterium]|nr:hypothetical protein [Saprospirales bacterium]
MAVTLIIDAKCMRETQVSKIGFIFRALVRGKPAAVLGINACRSLQATAEIPGNLLPLAPSWASVSSVVVSPELPWQAKKVVPKKANNTMLNNLKFMAIIFM